MDWTSSFKVLLAGVVGGIVPIAALVVPTVTTLDWTQRWGTLLIAYGLSAAASAALYWMKSPSGRVIWTDEEREARRAGKL